MKTPRQDRDQYSINVKLFGSGGTAMSPQGQYFCSAEGPETSAQVGPPAGPAFVPSKGRIPQVIQEARSSAVRWGPGRVLGGWQQLAHCVETLLFRRLWTKVLQGRFNLPLTV